MAADHPGRSLLQNGHASRARVSSAGAQHRVSPQAYMCFNWKDHKALSEFNMVITPYVPNVIDVNEPEETFGRKASSELEDRPTLVYFSGRCTPNHDHYYGKMLRCTLLTGAAF